MDVNRQKTVFISGSAYEYGPLGDEGQSFIRELSRGLLKNDFKIISGFGAGVGNFVVEAALDEIYTVRKEKMTDQLKVFPFPTRAAALLETIQADYRQDIISQAGIAIFLFGNKLEDISIREADGMQKEFDIARSCKALLIPVGASGYIARKLWQQVLETYDDYFDNREKFPLYEQLGNPGIPIDGLIDAILQIAQ